MKSKAIILAIAAVAVTAIAGLQAYTLNGPKWGVSSVPYYVNPTNLDVSTTAAISAVQTGASEWSTQTRAGVALSYAGTTSGTTVQNNGKNEIMFRNASNGGTVAEVTWWADANNRLVDADMVFWDGAYTFFTGSTGCTGGLYIEDIATHEFGHILGLGHSATASATMYPTASWCSTDWRYLDPDDIAGIETLYPASTSPTNSAPSVSITSPANNTQATEGTWVTFSGTATDQQDGTISNWITWTSNLDGQIGTGASVLGLLSVGTHTITARVTDSAGASTSKQETVTVISAVPPAPSGISLAARGYKVKGQKRVDLTWSNAATASVDVFRNGVRIMTTANDGAQTDSMTAKGGGTFSYKVCEAGSSTCSNSVSVVF